MNIEPFDIYTDEDIEKAFNMGFVTAITEFEKMMDLPHDRLRLILQYMKSILHEDEDNLERTIHNQSKVVNLQSYREK